MNTVQTDTRRRCSNTPNLAALTVAAPPPLTPSRPRPDPPPHNARQRNIGHPRGQPPRRHNDLTCRNLRAHRGRQPPFAVLTALRRVAGHGLAVRTWRHPNGTNALRSLEPTPCGGGCLPLHCKAAPHRRCITKDRLPGAHTHDTRPAASATTHRHNGIPTQAPPHAPNAARRRTATLRLPWRALMKGRAAITHQSKTFIAQQPTVSQRLLWPSFSVGLHCSACHHRPVAPATSAARHADTHRVCRHITPTCFPDLQMISPRVYWPR